MRVTVVIPAYNEEKYLGRALDSLTRQDTKLPFEVIVVDNNSTDKTAAVAQKFASRLNLKIIKETRPGRGAARAAGFAKAKGDYILSTDADTQVPTDWIEKIVQELNRKHYVVVTGACYFSGVTGLKKYFLDWFQPVFMKLYRVIFGHNILCGFNFGIKRQIYLQVGGFNPDLVAIEDVELTKRVAKFGKIKLLTETKVVCSGRRFKNAMFREIFSYVTSYINFFMLKRS